MTRFFLTSIIASSVMFQIAFADDCVTRWDQLRNENPVGAVEVFRNITHVKKPMYDKTTTVMETRTVAENTAGRLLIHVLAVNQSGQQKEDDEVIAHDTFIQRCQSGDPDAATIIREGDQELVTEAGTFPCHYKVYQQNDFTINTQYWTDINGYQLKVKDATESKTFSIEAQIYRDLISRTK